MREKLQFLNRSPWVDAVIITLAIASIALLIYELSVPHRTDIIPLIHRLDLAIAFIFLAEFSLSLYASQNRWRYFKRNWPDLLASIPVTGDMARSLRFLRTLRIIRILQVRRIGSVADLLRHGSTVFIYTLTIATVLLLAGATTFFTWEQGPNSEINTFFDALWWSVGTATVGYGDISPATGQGRVIGMILMLAGVIIMGTIAGVVGGTIFARGKEKMKEEIEEEVEEEVEEEIEGALRERPRNP